MCDLQATLCTLDASMTPILQSRLPMAPWMDARTARLPGVLPVQEATWLQLDDAFDGQMALRDKLIAEQPDAVVGQLPSGLPAAEELFDVILSQLSSVAGYSVATDSVTRPDGITALLNRARPLATLGRLVQEDLCLMEKQGDQHVLTGACLCFPSSWALSEKLGRPLTGIHRTVAVYEDDLARRVQRMFDVIRPEQPLWRMNALVYVNPDLHQPGFEGAPRVDRRSGQYLRAERQTFVKLPQTGAVLFAIHTYVVRLDSLTTDERLGLDAARL